jgi:hypothetical protein
MKRYSLNQLNTHTPTVYGIGGVFGMLSGNGFGVSVLMK